MRSIFFLLSVFTLTSCGFMRKGTLVIHEEVKPKLEPTFQGAYARDDEEPPKKDRLIVNLHYNDWAGDRQEVKTGWRSIGFDVNGLFDFPVNKKSTFSMASGFRLSRSVVQHYGLFQVGQGQNYSILYPTSTIDFNRSNQRFIQTYLDVPLEFRFRGVALKSYRFTIGASMGIRLNSFEKWREGDLKFREYNHPNTSFFRAGTFVRVGYHRLSLYANYFVSPVFFTKLDSKLNLFQIGLSITLF